MPNKIYRPKQEVNTTMRVEMAMRETEIVGNVLRDAKEMGDRSAILSRRAIDVREVHNLATAHAYCFRANKRAEELELYWSKRDDIVYASESMGYKGREAVYDYYVTKIGDVQKERLARACELFPQLENNPDNIGVGDLALDLTTTPYIEIAGDGQTAQGVWMILSGRVELNGDGKPVLDHIRSRWGFDFVKEDGQWKIWHFRQFADMCAEARLADPGKKRAFAAFIAKFNGEDPAPESTIYSPASAPKFEPGLPIL